LKISKIELAGFRCLLQGSFSLGNLTVFSGDMGTGKTSKLLSIFYCLTGSAPAGLTLDDLINVDSDFMWVKVTMANGQTDTIERRKKRKSSSTISTSLAEMPPYDARMFIEGRQIASLFVGATAEKSVRIDAMLGLAEYNQIATEISILPVERKINKLRGLVDKSQENKTTSERLKQITVNIEPIEAKLKENAKHADSFIKDYLWAQNIEKTAEEARKAEAMMQSKQALLESYRKQRASLPSYDQATKDELNELQSKRDAVERRVTFLEAAMQTLDIEGKKLEELVTCPLCGALLDPNVLSKFKDYDEEYKKHSYELMTIRGELDEKRKQVEQADKNKQKIEFLTSQIGELEREISSLGQSVKVISDLQRARDIVRKYGEISLEKRELEIRRSSMLEQKESLMALEKELQGVVEEDLGKKILRLEGLQSSLNKIKSAMLEALSEARTSHLEKIRDSFKSTFSKIYPYERFVDVDFDTQTIRGKDVMIVKAMVDGKWITSSQMSTGENVALSFALLYSINELEGSPILLLDEPEEGLDENGIRGLADVMHSLSNNTQVVIATRNELLSKLLSK